jgi:hypothetical protein
MSPRLDGNVAIVTSGATGIGNAIALGSPGETSASTAQRCELRQRMFDPGWPRTHAWSAQPGEKGDTDMSIER